MNIIISIIIIVAAYLVTMFFIIKPYLESKNELLDKKYKNELYELYTKIKPEAVQESLNNMVDIKIQEFILYNIRTREAQYMNSKDVDKMIKTVTSDLYLSLSELYVFYIKLIYNIENDEDVLTYLNKLVKRRSIDIVAENNAER